MRSVVAYTTEIDDLDIATEELLMQVRDFAFAQHSMGILFTEEDTDYPALFARLSQHWDFPILGCTAMAMLSGKNGYCRSGISVMILTADDCRFSAGVTNELDGEHFEEDVARLYRKLKAEHTEEPKLGLCYLGFEVDAQNMSGSKLLAALNREAEGLPLYGGVASDNLTFTGYRLFYNDHVVKNGAALALISGNISPRFVRVNSVEHTANFSYEITRAEGNVVYRLGESSFVDTLKREHMRVDQERVTSAYILSPFVLTADRGDGDMVTVARILSRLDLKTGSGTFLGVMPEGATLGIGLINRDDVCRSVEEAFARMFRELAQSKEEHTVFLCTSCSARYLALMNDPSVEAKTYLRRLPDNVSLMGLYAYGECCPVQGEKTGKQYNVYHNFTFTILAL